MTFTTHFLCEIAVFRFKFHWYAFPRVQLTISHLWFSWWPGAKQATGPHLSQWMCIQLTHIYITWSHWVNLAHITICVETWRLVRPPSSAHQSHHWLSNRPPCSSSSSSSIACAQVIRVAHSGWRSSCYVYSGFLAFLLFRWYFPTGFSGCRDFLQIFCCTLFSHGVFLFPGSLAGYVAGFLFVGRIACRIGLGHIRFCSLLKPSSLMLWFWLWHYTVFCLIYPCILV